MKKFLMLFLAFWFGRRVERYGSAISSGVRKVLVRRISDWLVDSVFPAAPKVGFKTPTTNPRAIGKKRSFGEVEVENIAEATSLLDNLNHMFEHNRIVTHQDLNDFLGLESNYTDRWYGWNQINGFGYKWTGRNSWLITIPDASSVKDLA